MDQTSSRKLVAVLALDVVGYSQMMGADDARTLDRLLRRRRSILEPLVIAHRGRVIKGTGDGILAEFASARDALHAAVRIQRALVEANTDEAGDTPMQARIGISTGDVIIADGDIYGDGVNIAARLEASAPTGGICVSGNALEEVRRLGIAYRDAGELDLKNISTPVRAYHIAPEAVATVDSRFIAADGVGIALSPDHALPEHPPSDSRLSRTRPAGSLISAAVLFVLLIVAGTWWWFRPPAVVAHDMTVRLAGFRVLSPDLPATIRDTVDAEIAAAFNADGVVGVSTASAQTASAAPAYALGGTIQREGQTIRVITQLTNERSGATVWGNNFDYDGNEVSKVPRHIAVDVGNVVRCGLFGASTYRKPLPDPVLRDYMQFCQGHWDPNLADGRKALVPAQRVVAAIPDFSWGWAAVAGGFWKVALSADNSEVIEEARASGRQAADRAVAIDSRNSEALYIKSMLVDRHDWIGRENLLKRAIDARRLDCGCEYHQYGWMLLNVGRVAEAVENLRQANDMLALYIYTTLNLADALIAAGKPEEARPLFSAAIGLAPNSRFADYVAMSEAVETGDVKSLLDPKLPLSAELRGALLKGYSAVTSGNAETKAEAVKTILALPESQQKEGVARLLADLGAVHESFQIAARLASREYPGPSIFWYAQMRATLSDPGFPLVAKKLGLLEYWQTNQVKPDVCGEKAAPPFCRMI